jgi:hypothetical protein
MPVLDDIAASIDARIDELKNEIAALQAARAALLDSPAPATTAASNKRAAKPTRRRVVKIATNGHVAEPALEAGDGTAAEPDAESSSDPAVGAPALPARKVTGRRAGRAKKSRKGVEVLLASTLEAMLGEADDGLSASAIAKRSNAAYGQVLELLRALESAGTIRRTGTRRTSLWRLISDEEWIAERAAELERLSVATGRAASRVS